MPVSSEQFTVTETAMEVCPPDVMTQNLILHNHEHSSGHEIYIGGSDVTVDNGLHLTPELEIRLQLRPGDGLWAVSNNDAEMHILRVTQD